MSLYWYVASKEELLDLMLDAIEAEIEVPEPSGDWRADLGAFAHRTRAALSRHMWAIEFIGTRPPSGPNDVRNLERLLSLLDETGVDDFHVIMGVFMTVATFVIGAVTREAQEIRFQREQDRVQANMTEAEVQAEHERFYTWFKNSGHYPHITRLMESGVDPDDPDTREERFQFSLDCVLDGIAARLVFQDRPAALACRTASATPWVHGSPCPGSSRSASIPSSASSEASAWPVSSFSPDGMMFSPYGMICGPIRPVSAFSVARTSPVSRARRPSNRSAAQPGVWPGGVHRPRAAGHVDLLAVGEGRHLRDRDHPAAAAAQQRERGAVERRPEQVDVILPSRLPVFPVRAACSSAWCDPYPGARLGAGPLGEPGVIRVRVGEQHRVDLGQPGPEPGQRAREVRPVARRPGVDHGVLAGFPDEVEVRDALRQPMDALAHLHWLASRTRCPRYVTTLPPQRPPRHRTYDWCRDSGPAVSRREPSPLG